MEDTFDETCVAALQPTDGLGMLRFGLSRPTFGALQPRWTWPDENCERLLHVGLRERRSSRCGNR
jgi:hypothetical protein